MKPTVQKYPLIIVTGAAGWLGSRIVSMIGKGNRELALEGTRLRCLVKPEQPSSDLRKVQAEIVCGDMRDVDTLAALFWKAEAALVIHVAGVIHPRNTRTFDEVNHQGTLNLLKAATAAGVSRFVAMSSNSPMGANPTPTDQFTEDSPYNPYMKYGRSKFLMERGLLGEIDKPGSPEIVVARAPWFYGPGQPPRQTLFFKMIKEGNFPIIGAGSNRRSMAYVDSLALGLLLCGQVPAAAGRIYWLADERSYSMLEIVDTVKAVLREDFNLKVSDKNLNVPSIIGDIARVADRCLQACGVYSQKIHVLSEMNLTIACDISRAKAELGYKPIVELREGMRLSVQWCLDHDVRI
jgi:nucleoside-diphosphate-sugar epimerase